MSDLPRKNCWTIAEHAGDTTPGKMQQLLEPAAKWDTMAAMAASAPSCASTWTTADAVAIRTSPGRRRRARMTVGVKRQYVGCSGRISNAINVVYCSFAAQDGARFGGARPYLPREWTTDPDLRISARVPEEVAFATKPQLGRQTPGRPACRRPPAALGDRRRGIWGRPEPARLAGISGHRLRPGHLQVDSGRLHQGRHGQG